jgi:hypothetical protein
MTGEEYGDPEIPLFLFTQFSVYNSSRSVVAMNTELGLDAQNMPKFIHLRNNSDEDTIYFFEQAGVHEAQSEDPTKDEDILAYVYKCEMLGHVWRATILIGDPVEPEVPDWMMQIEQFAKMQRISYLRSSEKREQ